VLRETRDRNGWLIFYTHDVAERASWIGCSPGLLRTAVEAAAAHGMQCLTVRDALAAIGYNATRKSAHRDQRLGHSGKTFAFDRGIGK